MTLNSDTNVHSNIKKALLAKSFGGAEQCAGLLFHLQCTFNAARLILDQTAKAQLESLGLDPTVYRERFERLVLLAAAIHDLGKANTRFQTMVSGQRKWTAQSIRHEWVLYLLLRMTPLGEWLQVTFEQHPHDFDYLVWAVTGHHRRILDDAAKGPAGMKLLVDHPDFKECIVWIVNTFNLPEPNFELATLEKTPWNVGSSRRRDKTVRKEETFGDVLGKDGRTLNECLKKCVYAYDEADDEDDENDENEIESMDIAESVMLRDKRDKEELRLMAAARSTLMAADVVASAAAGTVPDSSKDASGANDCCGAAVVDEQDGQDGMNPAKVDEPPCVLERIKAWISGGTIGANDIDAKDIAAGDNRKVGTLADLPNKTFYNDVIEKKQGEIQGKIDPIVESSSNATLSQERQKFQEDVAHSNSRVTLVSAGCGSGKTLAAYLWAAKQCPDTGRRLCFCYPTTGTATEGYMDYLLGEGDEWGKLIHSRSNADYQIFERLQQVRQDNEDPELLSVMRSLHFWKGKIVCCTVDTVLGFLVNTYSGHLAWSALVQSMFVFDEIHSYDERLFGWLLEFLKTMRGSKILLMTASLPKHRRQAIEKVLADQDETLGIVNGPEEWEKIKRYQWYTPAKSTVNTSATTLAGSHGTLCSPELAVQEAIASYQKGEKVLYICNTVDRAIGMALQIHEQMKRMKLIGDDVLPSANPALIVYHSHFKYEDRVKRHEAIIAAFRKREGVICVTTQVAEMSLDISADFLISELAPIAAMIQRLGRLNRRTLTDSPRPFMVVALPIDSDGNFGLQPYSKNTEPMVWFDEASEWLESLGDEALSQAALVSHWKDSKTPDSHQDEIHWLLRGPEMTHGSLRESNTGCEVILAEDVQELQGAIQRGEAKAVYTRLVIPMPPPPASVKKSMEKDPNPKYGCFIAQNGKEIEYDETIGGIWHKENA